MNNIMIIIIVVKNLGQLCSSKLGRPLMHFHPSVRRLRVQAWERCREMKSRGENLLYQQIGGQYQEIFRPRAVIKSRPYFPLALFRGIPHSFNSTLTLQQLMIVGSSLLGFKPLRRLKFAQKKVRLDFWWKFLVVNHSQLRVSG